MSRGLEEVPAPTSTYISDLAYAARSDDFQQHVFDQFIFPGERDSFFTPPICFRISKSLEFQKNLIDKIQETATQYRVQNGIELPKGLVVQTLPDAPHIPRVYLQWFCRNDPVPYNHNGYTPVTTVNARNQPQHARPQTLLEFRNYMCTGDPQKVDSLGYFQDSTGAEYIKYDMPKILFTVVQPGGGAAAIVRLEPSTFATKFIRNREGMAVQTDNHPGPFPNSVDFQNLQEVITSNPSFKIEELNNLYTFPNFLSEDMLFTSPPDIVSNNVSRPFRNEKGQLNEVWVKSYGRFGYNFPFNPDIYHLPPGWNMMVRADGIIMYYNGNTLQLEFPLGSYYKKAANTRITDVFKPTERRRVIALEVDRIIGQLGLNQLQMGTPGNQQLLKAISYLANLEYVKGDLGVLVGGKKKTKRTNIIKYMAKSKKKYHK
jgi:hypothetical protein